MQIWNGIFGFCFPILGNDLHPHAPQRLAQWKGYLACSRNGFLALEVRPVSRPSRTVHLSFTFPHRNISLKLWSIKGPSQKQFFPFNGLRSREEGSHVPGLGAGSQEEAGKRQLWRETLALKGTDRDYSGIAEDLRGAPWGTKPGGGAKPARKRRKSVYM